LRCCRLEVHNWDKTDSVTPVPDQPHRHGPPKETKLNPNPNTNASPNPNPTYPTNPVNQLDQRPVGASIINAFKGCLNKIRETRIGFFMD